MPKLQKKRYFVKEEILQDYQTWQVAYGDYFGGIA